MNGHAWVRDVISSYPPPLTTTQPLAAAQQWCQWHGQTVILVVDEQGSLVGVLTQRQVELACHHGLADHNLGQWLMPLPPLVDVHQPVPEILSLLGEWDVLPVLEEQRWVGVLSRQEVWRQCYGEQPQPVDIHDLPLADRAKLTFVRQTATPLGLDLFLVGGVVRDLLLGCLSPDPDMDVVVVAQAGMDAVTLGQRCVERDPELHLTVHEAYRTVTVTWPDGRWIDMATARTEFYPAPGDPPQVSPSDLRQDLARRDFSINALALKMTIADQGSLVDLFQGEADLAQRHLRILHPHSFVEDPTRIFRASRFVARLGFRLDPWTERMMQTTLSSGIHDGRGGFRLRRECEYLLDTPTWPTAFAVLHQWGAWRCLDPGWQWSGALARAVRRTERWFSYFARRDPHLATEWRVSLKLEAALMGQADPITVAQRLHLPGHRLSLLTAALALRQRLQSWSPEVTAGWVDHELAKVGIPTLIVVAAQVSPPLRRLLQRYLTRWRPQKTLLSGKDLMALGLQPGSQFQEILAAVRAAQLDGQILSVDAARHFVLAWLKQVGA
ncbi:MAG: CBS domain-containing protein [Synechococcales cyanobacterium]